MRTQLVPVVLVLAALACSRATVSDTEDPADRATSLDQAADASPDGAKPEIAPLCPGDRGLALDEFSLNPLYNYPGFPRAFVMPLGGKGVPAYDKEPATLLGTRALEPAMNVPCEGPFDSDGPPCFAQAVLRLQLGDGSILEMLTNTPLPEVALLGENIPVRMTTTYGPNRYAPRFEGFTLFAAADDTLLYAIYDIEREGMNAVVAPLNVGPLKVENGALTCVTTTDPCRHKFGASTLIVSEGETSVELRPLTENGLRAASGYYYIRHRTSAREIPSGSEYPGCGNDTPTRLSFDLVRRP